MAATRRIPLQYRPAGPRLDAQRSVSAWSVPAAAAAANATTTTPVAVETRDSADENELLAMVNVDGAAYVAEMQVDGATYRVQVDTGSSDLWLSCYYMEPTRCQTECPAGATIIHYGSGNVCVTLSTARIQLGALAIDDYAFGFALGANVVPPAISGVDNLLLGDAQGLLGLGYPALASFPSDVGYMLDFLDSFSMHLTTKDGADGSFLLLNGVDETFIAENRLVGYALPLRARTHWTLGMRAFQVGSDAAVTPCVSPDASDQSCMVILDSGTSFLYMPARFYDAFVESYLVPSGCYTLPHVSSDELFICDRDVALPRLRLTMGDVTFYLDMADYSIVASSTKLIMELQPTPRSVSMGDAWILGDTFLKLFYTHYRVGAGVTLYCEHERSCDANGRDVVVVGGAENGDVGDTNDGRPDLNGAADVPSPSPTTAPVLNGDATTNEPVNGTSEASSGRAGDGVSSGTIALITVASVVVVALALLVAWRFVRKKRRQLKREDEMVASTEDGATPTIHSSEEVGSLAYVSGGALTPLR